MKKIVAFLLAVAMLMSFALVTGAEESTASPTEPTYEYTEPEEKGIASGTCGDDLTWVLTDDGTLTISGTGRMYNYDYDIDCAPWMNPSVKNVIIEDGVTSIGASAFAFCNNLTTITIPDSVNNIGIEAFFYCINLTSVNIPDGVTVIHDQTFARCTSLTSVTIPDSVTEIGRSAFSSCISLPSITIPDSVNSISEYAFNNCAGLTSIIIPDGITKINDYVFNKCTSLTSITIPDSVTHIYKYAFGNCTSLSSITIPDSVVVIDDDVFNNCTSLTSITFTGNAPASLDPDFRDRMFYNVTATAYYPIGNSTWTEKVMKNYGGTITWVPYGEEGPFKDVYTTDKHFDAIMWAYENGITTGSYGRFNGDYAVTRREAVMFLWRVMGKPAHSVTENPFPDVSETSIYYDAIMWAYENGITTGSNGKFNPTATVNRAQLIMFLWRAMGKPAHNGTENPFSDVSETSIYYDAIMWAYETGLTGSATTFARYKCYTRQDVITLLYQLMGQ